MLLRLLLWVARACSRNDSLLLCALLLSQPCFGIEHGTLRNRTIRWFGWGLCGCPDIGIELKARLLSVRNEMLRDPLRTDGPAVGLPGLQGLTTNLAAIAFIRLARGMDPCFGCAEVTDHVGQARDEVLGLS